MPSMDTPNTAIPVTDHSLLAQSPPDLAAAAAATSSMPVSPTAADLGVSPLSPTPFRQGFVQRTLSPMTAGGIRQSTFTLISTAMGGGVLCLPYVYDQCGWLLATLLLTLSAGIAYLTMYILIVCANRTGKFSYGALLGHCTGKWSGPVLDLIMFTYGNGALIAYFILLGDFIPTLMSSVGAPHPLTERTFVMCVCAFIALPMTLPRRLSALQYVAPVATFSLVFTAGSVVSVAAYWHGQLPPTAEPMKAIHPGIQVLKCFSICLFAYICHLNVVPVGGELVDPTPQRVVKITGRVAGMLLFFYILIGFCGYFSFGNFTNQNFITNYPTSDLLVNLCRVFLSSSLLFCVPINVNPTAKALVHFIETSTRQRRPSTLAGPLLGGTTTHRDIEHLRGLRIAITVCVLCLTLTVALVVPGVADVVGLLGGSLGTFMMMTAPAMIYVKVMPAEARTLRGRLLVGTLLGGTCVAALAIVAMVLNFMGLIAIDRHAAAALTATLDPYRLDSHGRLAGQQ